MNDDLFAGLLVGPLIVLVLVASLWGWWRAFDRLTRGQPLLDYEPRCESPWGLVDLLITCFLVLACQASAAWLLANKFGIEIQAELADQTPDARAAVLLAAAAAMTAAFLISIILVRLRTGATLVDLGVDRRQLATDLRIGFTAFAMLAPIVYGIQILLVRWVESKHPLIELLRQHPDPRFFVISGVAALIVAPLAEEYFFRVLFQGWLERLAFSRGDTKQVILGGRPAGQQPDQLAKGPDESKQLEEPEVPGEQNPYRPSLERQFDVDTQPEDWDNRGKLEAWPILVSAVLFALAHYSHGPDPIPLFVLAVGLGYMYQRTHRVFSCIVVHFLLNSCSLVVLWLVVFSSEQPGS